jgi:hypothetical protein
MKIRAATSRPSRRSNLALIAGFGLGLVSGNGTRAAALAQPPKAAALAPPVLIDGLAAVLGGTQPGDTARAILLGDVELSARLSLLARDPERAVLGELPGSLLRATLDELLGEQLIAAEAERMQIVAPSGVEVASELAAIEEEAGGERAVLRLLARLDASRLELEAMARRRALIGAFLRANLEGIGTVTERDIETRLAADAARYAALEPDRAHAAAKAVIEREALRRNIERWVRVLRARTPVRILAVFEAS